VNCSAISPKIVTATFYYFSVTSAREVLDDFWWGFAVVDSPRHVHQLARVSSSGNQQVKEFGGVIAV
jgi:hypothetical protein